MEDIKNNFLPDATSEYTKILQDAQQFAYCHKVKYVATEFIIAVMLDGCGKISALFKRYGVTEDTYAPRLEQYISVNYAYEGFTGNTKKNMNYSEKLAMDNGCSYVAPEHLLVAILSNKNCIAYQILISISSNYAAMYNDAVSLMLSLSQKHIAADNSGNGKIGYGPYAPSIDLSPLENFGVDLTAKAHLNKIDPVIGRDREITRVIETLSRRIKSNPLLIGEPGVGKTAVVEGLALKIARGEVPITLKNKVVFSLDLSSVIAGAKYKGEFEQRFKSALKFASENGVILFIDEIHMILSGYQELGVSDILKPALARGDLHVIGATTTAEYNKYIESDAALERRFLVIKVDPPKTDDCIEILKGLRDKFEAHHGVKITDSAINAATYLSDRYISDRFLPDKAIDLIDEAAAKERLLADMPPETLILKEKQMRSYERDRQYSLSIGKDCRDIDDKIKSLQTEIEDIKRADMKRQIHLFPVIDEESIASVVSEVTGIPVAKLTETESNRLLNFESVLAKRVVGQQAAVSAVARAIRRSVTCVKDPGKPNGSFLFVGPTGVGKTELSKALAEALFGDENMLFRFDMSEYMESASVSKLIGSPPGYVGYEEEGQLTGKVRMKPYCVVLFDEIEKAHPDIFNIMLQILDDGRLTDSKGRTVDFKNTVVIMTSNEGASVQKTPNKIGFSGNADTSDNEEQKEKITEALKKKFRPEFLNRIDEIVVFRKLTMEECGKICDLIFDALKKRLRRMNVSLQVSAPAKKLILEKGYSSEYGARPIKRTVANFIETPLSDMIIKGDIHAGSDVTVIVDDGVIDFIVV